MKYVVCLVALCLLVSSALGFDTITSLSGGSLIQEGAHPAFCFVAGFDVPVIVKDSAGFTGQLEVSYAYSNKYGVENLGEVSAVRTMGVVTKTLGFIGPGFWNNIYLGIGSGTWNFINTGGDDKLKSAYNAQAGIKTGGFATYAGIDLIPISGNNLIYPHFNVFIHF